eukprot:CAMPEP_0175233238 /NCGR_PEP_ID=MMETSP0093-20121207/26367_1 /TAXON_ID=311494 /ORGANISM="Alexandrium monilatum, Strain CCMP3105" /LENGTH=63 /DNA_ID=CAMNT_0016527111 /DNA_START=363 /DNA_END=550 /DNA_ORIENTATION=+
MTSWYMALTSRLCSSVSWLTSSFASCAATSWKTWPPLAPTLSRANGRSGEPTGMAREPHWANG